jgi:hypothetical protein
MQLSPKCSFTGLAGSDDAYAPSPSDQTGNDHTGEPVQPWHDYSWPNLRFILSKPLIGPYIPYASDAFGMRGPGDPEVIAARQMVAGDLRN